MGTLTDHGQRSSLFLVSSSGPLASGGIVSWRENMTTECAQDPTVRRVFLRKEFPGFLRIFAELFFGPEDVDLLFIPLNEVDEVDVLLEDDLRPDEKKYRSITDTQGNQSGPQTSGNSRHDILEAFPGPGQSSGRDRACASS